MLRRVKGFFEEYKKGIIIVLVIISLMILISTAYYEIYGLFFSYFMFALFVTVMAISSSIRIYIDSQSVRLNRYESLNKECLSKIQRIESYIKIFHELNSKRQIESVNVKSRVVKDYIEKHEAEIKEYLKKIEKNSVLEKKYYQELENIDKLPEIDKYTFLEKYKLNRNRLSFQKTFYLVFHFQYISPMGQNRYDQKIEFNSDEIKKILKELEEAKKSKSAREIERSKMTSKLRYDILHRDNFTCQLCGATQSHGTTLHVDHIHPVAKGGLTEEANLRTLCADCNLGKGDRIEYNTPK